MMIPFFVVRIYNWCASVQKALKEKQEHVEQLLKERDLERSEFAKTAAQIDEASASVIIWHDDVTLIIA